MTGNRMTAAQLQAFYKADGDHSAPRQDREGPIHKAILQLLDLCLPGDAIYHHSPNELEEFAERCVSGMGPAGGRA